MSAATPRKSLPRECYPRKLVSQQESLSATVSVADLPRVVEMLASDAGEIAVELCFDRDEAGKPRVTGSLNGEVQITCQRCLDAMPLAIASDIDVGIVWDDDQAKALAKDVEPWLVGEDPEDLYGLVEDEILLALPYAAYHEEPCGPEWKDEDSAEQASNSDLQSDARENPFKVLEQLKGKS